MYQNHELLSVAIRELLSNNYEIFIPLQSNNSIIIKYNNRIYDCKFILASYVRNTSNPLVQIPKSGTDDNFFSYHYLMPVDDKYNKIWIIPMSMVNSLTKFRLGEKYEHFKLEINQELGVRKPFKPEDKPLIKDEIEAFRIKHREIEETKKLMKISPFEKPLDQVNNYEEL